MEKRSIDLKGKVFHTDRNGLWSLSSKPVTIKEIRTSWVDPYDSDNYATFRLYFDVSSWDRAVDGCMYANARFIKELRQELLAQGLSTSAVDDLEYTELDLQGYDYVHLGARRNFLNEINLPPQA